MTFNAKPFGFRSFLLTGAALAALATGAQAQASKPRAATAAATAAAAQQARLDQLERQVDALRQQVEQARQESANANSSAALVDLKRSTSDQYVDINGRIDALPKTGIDNGRFTIASADGRFTFALRTLIQYDVGYFSQGKNPPAVDLNSGGNFRRAQVGFTGTAWRDWSYNLTLDFGGNGLENSGYIYTAFLQYDGFKPFGIKIGAYAPPAGIEDSTGSADLLFLERPAATDVARNIAGSPSRNAITLFRQTDDYLISASYTGDKVNVGSNTKLNTASFDEQQAFVGRASWLAVNRPDIKWLLDADLTHVFKLADTVAGGLVTPATTLTSFSFSSGPEVGIDSTKTVNTGTIDAASVTQWGLETALEYQSFYAQGGYFHYTIERRTGAIPSPNFNGFYGLLTWSLTGEAHRYDPTTASFRGLRPAAALGNGGIGAWEAKARFSDLDLDYQPLLAAAAGGVAGGHQQVWSVGLNWYPTDGIRFALDYDNIQVNHPNAPATDISASAVALRSQISL